MQSQFETMKDDPFLTFVVSFHPPPATPSPPTTSSPLVTSSSPFTTSTLPTTSTVSTISALSTASSPSTANSLFSTRTQSTRPTTPMSSPALLTPPLTPPTTPPSSVLTITESPPESTLPSLFGPTTSLTRPASISQMSDDELQEALSEYKKSSLLLPAQLVPGSPGKISIENFCRMYELPEDIPLLLAQIGVKDAHGLSSKRLSHLRDKGMTPRSVKMLQLAVIRFSTESGSCGRRY
ncbi:hypothetical protein BJY52DRAFT_1216429 [Lactarius psammicola]|nr:hypothetical protein BJY52DRAFT_1216429 [Lactarius psammicola]